MKNKRAMLNDSTMKTKRNYLKMISKRFIER